MSPEGVALPHPLRMRLAAALQEISLLQDDGA
ncbi:hypothetical protein QE374_001975 [Microbacterium sp. SORGH_AS428]|nr:hypothetical protein [Microbacterium sp. SORGH_AS_0428]